MGKKKDHCSFWPDGTYGECCEAHDICYTVGGTARDRAACDKALRECIKEKQGSFMAWTMWLGVRFVGWLPHHFKRKKLNWNQEGEEPKP